MTTGPQAPAVSTRVRELIVDHDQGNTRTAASRIGITPARLTGLLSGDWTQFSLDALAALVTAYGISVAWLLTGRNECN